MPLLVTALRDIFRMPQFFRRKKGAYLGRAGSPILVLVPAVCELHVLVWVGGNTRPVSVQANIRKGDEASLLGVKMVHFFFTYLRIPYC